MIWELCSVLCRKSRQRTLNLRSLYLRLVGEGTGVGERWGVVEGGMVEGMRGRARLSVVEVNAEQIYVNWGESLSFAAMKLTTCIDRSGLR